MTTDLAEPERAGSGLSEPESEQEPVRLAQSGQVRGLSDQALPIASLTTLSPLVMATVEVKGQWCFADQSGVEEVPGQRRGRFDTNQDYKRTVNRLLFGFRDLRDFDALIDLLLQIRRPKLTREVKPRDVAEILTHTGRRTRTGPGRPWRKKESVSRLCLRQLILPME